MNFPFLRILGEPSRRRHEAPPPDYHHQNRQQSAQNADRRTVTVSCIEMGPRPMYNSSTMERRHRSSNAPTTAQQSSQPVQPQDVALLLRPGRLLPPYNQRTMSLGDAGIQREDSINRRHSRSVENLILTTDKDTVAGNNQSVI